MCEVSWFKNNQGCQRSQEHTGSICQPALPVPGDLPGHLIQPWVVLRLVCVLLIIALPVCFDSAVSLCIPVILSLVFLLPPPRPVSASLSTSPGLGLIARDGLVMP